MNFYDSPPFYSEYESSYDIPCDVDIVNEFKSLTMKVFDVLYDPSTEDIIFLHTKRNLANQKFYTRHEERLVGATNIVPLGFSLHTPNYLSTLYNRHDLERRTARVKPETVVYQRFFMRFEYEDILIQ